MAIWAQWLKPSAGLPTVQWSLLLALAAAVGHLLQRYSGLPKVVGYSMVGMLAGLAGFSGAAWPLQGVALFLLLFIGVGNALVDVGVFTLVARLTPSTMVARVFGVMEGLGALFVGVGAAVTPVAIGLLGTRGALVAIGLVSPALVAVSWLGLRRLDGSMERRDQEVDLLQAVPMLAGLPLPAVEELAIALEPVTVAAGGTVFSQGDLGDRCYFVEAGSATVIGDGREVTELGPGEMFGEIALLRHVPRTATVRAHEDLQLQALRSDAFLPVVTGYRSSAGRASSDVAARLDRFAPRGPGPERSRDQDV